MKLRSAVRTLRARDFVHACLLILVLAAGGAAFARPLGTPAREALARLGAELADDGVSFQQVQFVFDAGRLLDSDWGREAVDVAKLRKRIGEEGGYLNVALHSDTRGGPVRAIANLRIPPDRDQRSEAIPDARLRAEKIVPGGEYPMTAHFDLRPGIVGRGASIASRRR